MNLTSLRYTGPFLFALAAAAQDTTTIVDTLFPGAVAGDRGPLLTRLVDDLTGAPIAGADVFLIGERNAPIAGEFWWVHRGTSDAEGFVRIDRPNGNRDWGWWVVRHPDRGTVSGDDHEPVWRIARTFDVPVRIVDWMGRPAPGAMVGLCGGCGHSPDLLYATADANGTAVLRGIDPRQGTADLYVQHPGLHFFYDSVRWRPGDDPMEVRCDRSIVQTGKVVDHRGLPIAGAFVCGGNKHRGPWARTAADGSFTVLGGEPEDCPYMVVLPGGRKFHFPNPSRYPVTMQLPDLADPEAHHGTIDVPDRSEVDEVEVARRVLTVHVTDAPSDDLSLDVDYPGFSGQTAERLAVGTIEVPTAGPFVLWVHDDTSAIWNPRSFVFDDARTLADPLVVTWLPDARVVARAVDTTGRPLAVRVRWLQSAEISYRRSGVRDDSADHPVACPDGRIELRRRVGWSLLEVAPEAKEMRPRILWVNVPGPDQARGALDLGAIVIGGPPRLRVVDAGDKPLAGAVAGYARAGWQEAGESSQWPLAADGTWQGPDLRAGDAIEVQVDESSLPFRTVLVGDGPWTITPPRGELRVQIVDPDGQPLAGGITFRDRFVEANGEATLRGLPVGEVRLHIGARGHRSAVVEAAVTEAVRVVRVTLPPR